MQLMQRLEVRLSHVATCKVESMTMWMIITDYGVLTTGYEADYLSAAFYVSTRMGNKLECWLISIK